MRGLCILTDNMSRWIIDYNDRYFRLGAAIAGALLATGFGSTDGIFKLLLSPEFYMEFLASLLIALVLVECIAGITRYLDRTYDWEEQPTVRVFFQVLLGVGLPGLIDFFLAAAYFKIFGLDIMADTEYMMYAFPYIMLMIVLFNLYYLSYYFFLKARKRHQPDDEHQAETKGMETLMVSKGVKHIPLPVEQIGYIQRTDKNNFLWTFTGESYLVPFSLDELQDMLCPQTFFRVNRQTIINYRACEHFEPAAYGKLELHLSLSPEEAVIVSQRRAVSFRKWIAR